MLHDFEKIHGDKCMSLMQNWHEFCSKVKPILKNKVKNHFESAAYLDFLHDESISKGNF